MSDHSYRAIAQYAAYLFGTAGVAFVTSILLIHALPPEEMTHIGLFIGMGLIGLMSFGFTPLQIAQCPRRPPAFLSDFVGVGLVSNLTLVALVAIPAVRGRLRWDVGAVLVPIGALTLGATVFERQFALNHTWKGTDHAAILDPNDMRRLVSHLKCISKTNASARH